MAALLYPHHHSKSDQTKKLVPHVVLRLADDDNLPPTKTKVSVSKINKESVYVISLNPSIMEENNFKYSFISAIQRAMARIWLYDGQSTAPPWLIDGMDEYIWMKADFGHGNNESALPFGREQLCSVFSKISSKSKMNISNICGDHKTKYSDDNKEPKIVAQALDYLEQENKGYIQRLNQILRNGWD